MRGSIVLSGVLLFAACYHGPSIYKFGPVQGAEGVDTDLHLRKTRVQGELLEVQDTALIVLTDSNKVVLVPLRGIEAGVFDKLGQLITEGVSPQSALVRVRPFSRFPAGLTRELRARLLAAYGQTELEVVR